MPALPKGWTGLKMAKSVGRMMRGQSPMSKIDLEIEQELAKICKLRDSSPHRHDHTLPGCYSVHNFVSDCLVPIDAWVCQKSGCDFMMAKELEMMMKRVNKILNERLKLRQLAMRKGVSTQRLTFPDMPKKKALPVQVVARLFLGETKVDCEEGTFDFDKGVPLGVTVFGKLFFPPTNGCRSEEDDEADGMEVENEPDQVWDLDIKVKAQISKVEVVKEQEWTTEMKGVKDDEEVQNVKGLQATCKSLLIGKTHQHHGDPMAESWLPMTDILQDINVLLNEKLSAECSTLVTPVSAGTRVRRNR